MTVPSGSLTHQPSTAGHDGSPSSAVHPESAMPAKQPRTRERRAAAGIGQCSEAVHAAPAVFEAAIQSQQVTGINRVSALPALTLRNPVEAINQVQRRWHVATVRIGHIQRDTDAQSFEHQKELAALHGLAAAFDLAQTILADETILPAASSRRILCLAAGAKPLRWDEQGERLRFR